MAIMDFAKQQGANAPAGGNMNFSAFGGNPTQGGNSFGFGMGKNTQSGGVTAYNQQREQGIKDMYANNLANQKAQLQTAYDKNMSDAQAAYDKISPQYQQRQNELSAEYERQRRNNNMQASANGLNTGAGSQMQLAQGVAYQGNQASMKRAENEALDNANRSMLDMKTDYQNRISEAVANNDYQMSAALLDEYNQAYQRNLNAAKQAADYGDFSLYVDIYGKEQADQMAKSWALQNPLLAYNLGKLTAQEYFNMTGTWPRGYTAPSSGGRGGYGGGAYYGPAGHYENGVWTLDSASPSGSSGGTSGSSSGRSYNINYNQLDRNDSWSPYAVVKK